MKISKKNGFTLVEVIVIVLIIGIISVTLVPKILHLQSRTHNSKRVIDTAQISNGLYQHRDMYGFFPVTLRALVDKKILISLPKDPLIPNMPEPCVGSANADIYRGAPVGRSQTGGYYNYAYYNYENPYHSFAFNGYTYYYSNTLGIAIIQAKMEIDGTNNSHIITAYGCGWIGTAREDINTITHIQFISDKSKTPMIEKGGFYVRSVVK